MVWRCAARTRPLSCPLWAVVGAYPPEAPHLLQDRLRLCEALDKGKTGDDRQRDCHRNPNEIFSEHLPQSSECVVQMRSLIGGLSQGCSPGECRLQLSLSFPSVAPLSPQRAQPRPGKMETTVSSFSISFFRFFIRIFCLVLQICIKFKKYL